MTIAIGQTTLCAGDTRNTTGDPVGPGNLSIADSPGVIKREYVGAARIKCERVLCDSGSVTFTVSRVFASVADAVTYIGSTMLAEEVAGPLKFDGNVIFSDAAVTSRRASQVGCAVAVQYTIEG